MTLAERLARHPNVTRRAIRAGEPPTHEAARRQLKGFGTISRSTSVAMPRPPTLCALGCRLIQHATSLGAVESTIERRAGVPGQEHLPPTLLRLSVGIEAVEDLWNDLDRACATWAGHVIDTATVHAPSCEAEAHFNHAGASPMPPRSSSGGGVSAPLAARLEGHAGWSERDFPQR